MSVPCDRRHPSPRPARWSWPPASSTSGRPTRRRWPGRTTGWRAGADRLVDAVIAHGTTEQVVARLDEHLRAGADHVPVQVIGGDLLAGYRTLAAALGLSGPAGG